MGEGARSRTQKFLVVSRACLCVSCCHQMGSEWCTERLLLHLAMKKFKVPQLLPVVIKTRLAKDFIENL